ncbi:MAG: hypothetical protein ACK55I_17980, partial [bacterium]
ADLRGPRRAHPTTQVADGHQGDDQAEAHDADVVAHQRGIDCVLARHQRCHGRQRHHRHRGHRMAHGQREHEVGERAAGQGCCAVDRSGGRNGSHGRSVPRRARTCAPRYPRRAAGHERKGRLAPYAGRSNRDARHGCPNGQEGGRRPRAPLVKARIGRAHGTIGPGSQVARSQSEGPPCALPHQPRT